MIEKVEFGGSTLIDITTREWNQCPEPSRKFIKEIEYTGELTLIWTPSFTATSGTITWTSSNTSIATVTSYDTNSAVVTGIAFATESSGNSTITAVRGSETKTLYVNVHRNADHTGTKSIITAINNFAPSLPVESNSKPIGNNVNGTVYYNEVPNIATPIISGAVKPIDQLRWFRTTIANGTYYLLGNNVRDLGGWTCDGGVVGYGKLIRGGEINPADKDLMVNKVGVRTEVNLLPTSQQQYTESAWNIDYVPNPTNLDFMYRVDISTTDIYTQWHLYLTTIFDSVAHYKPVYFHCGAGADKTGTLACMLLAILGVSESDIEKDFELTTFSFSANSTSGRSYRGRDVYIAKFLGNIKAITLYSGLEDSFRNRAVSFALSAGATIGQINAFRNACINGTPTPITIGFSITNNLTNCTNSNTATSVSSGSSYTGTISANSGCTLSTITVTMGGTDITSTAVSGGSISIASVTGAIIITANAIKEATNILDTYGYYNDTRISLSSGNVGKRVTSTGKCATGLIPISSGNVIRAKGFTFSSSTTGIICFFTTETAGFGKSEMTSGNTYTTQGNTIEISSDNIMTVTINNNDYLYCAFSGGCTDGANAFVTMDEPLPS